MTYHKNKWIEFRGVFYSRNPNAAGNYLVGKFNKDHKLYVEGGVPYRELPEGVKKDVNKESKAK